ncbi:MAG: NTPase [Thermoplasmatota archaeon]
MHQTKPKIGITGLPNVGKTATLAAICRKLERDDFIVGGMITRAYRPDPNGERIGFYVENWETGDKEVFSSKEFANKEGCERNKTETDDGMYYVDTEVLDRIGVAAIRESMLDEEVDIIIIDEVGKMEMHSEAFNAVVKEALDCPKPIIMTLHKKSRNPLLQDLRRRDDVRILEVTAVNKNLLPYKIEKLLKDHMQTTYY